MNKSIVPFALVLFSFISFLSGCEERLTTPPDWGILRISITDAPATFEAVNITFSEISVHTNGQWITVRDSREDPITINLLEWNNGKSIVIGEAEVPSGLYTQVRLIIISANVSINETQYELFVPSGAQSGLKFGPQFTVHPGTTAELVIDFDAERSVVRTGPPQNPKRYLLKPTIRVVPKAITGAISGTVTNPEHLPIAYALAGADTVTSSPVDSTGDFTLAFLTEGWYTIAIQDTLQQFFEEKDVAVAPGVATTIGSITLQ